MLQQRPVEALACAAGPMIQQDLVRRRVLRPPDIVRILDAERLHDTEVAGFFPDTVYFIRNAASLFHIARAIIHRASPSLTCRHKRLEVSPRFPGGGDIHRSFTAVHSEPSPIRGAEPRDVVIVLRTVELHHVERAMLQGLQDVLDAGVHEDPDGTDARVQLPA